MKEELSALFHTIFDTLDMRHAHIQGFEGEFRADTCERLADEVLKMMEKHGYRQVQ